MKRRRPRPDPKVIASLLARQDQLLKTYGWFTHRLIAGGAVEAHTHGLPSHCGRPDQQIRIHQIAVPAEDLLSAIVSCFEQGGRWEEGPIPLATPITGILADSLPLLFVPAIEGNRQVLRVILPDPAGKLGPDGAQPPYRLQWEGVLSREPAQMPKIAPGDEFRWASGN